MSKKLKLGIVLFLLGFAGVLSLITMQIELPKEATDRFSPEMIKLLILIGPAIYLLITVTIGTLLYDKVLLTVPTISSALKNGPQSTKFSSQLSAGTLGGILAGVLIVINSLVFKSSIPESFTALSEKIQLTVLARFLYGGITEELLMRYGLMTLFVWLVFKVTKKLNPATYWIGILLAAILFALGHFPVVYSIVPNPPPTLLLYMLFGNSIAGIVFGWLYWKKGLESAFIAHIVTHIVMMAGESIFKV